MSSGLRHLLVTALSWLFVAACGFVSVVYYKELKVVTATLLGLPTPDSFAALETAPQRDDAIEPARQQASASRGSGSTVELRAGQNGHFTTSASVNGRPIDVMVDTGASIVALTAEDADRAGIFVRANDFTGRVSTANGVARVAPVMIDSITIGDITVRNVKGVVAESGNLQTTLLGMSFLGKLSRAEMRRGQLVLEE